MTKIVNACSAFPKYRHSQREIVALLQKVWPAQEAVLARLEKTSGVEHRNFSIPLDAYATLGGFEQRNKFYLEAMLSALEKAVIGLQEKTNFPWQDIAVMVSNTITGVAVPSLDARLMNRLPIPRDVLRTPILGLGCMGGVASLNRAAALLRAFPNKLALVMAAEACSLTFQLNDPTMANLVAASLFGDGAAAVLLAGPEHPLAKNAPLEILGGAATFYPDSERVMGWDMVDTGFKIVLSGNVPDIVREHVGDDTRSFLKRHGLTFPQINGLVSHPGGPKVLTALSEVLEKDEKKFSHSWESLREQGNMSSVSALNVLERTIDAGSLEPGYALALAMGPAFNSEITLFKVHQ